jgi:hypothetical protein
MDGLSAVMRACPTVDHVSKREETDTDPASLLFTWIPLSNAPIPGNLLTNEPVQIA